MARMLFFCVVYASVLKCVAMAISTSSPVAPGTSMPQSLSVTHGETSTENRNKKKKTTSMDSSLLKYLRKFKYLDPSPCPSCDQDSSIISEALSTLQQWAHINNTGILDSDTVEVMSKRRCGVPDEPKQFSVSSIKNKRHKRSFFWQIYHGSRWYKNDLTYIINMPYKFPNKRAVKRIISAALHAWERVTQLTFTQKRYGYADIEVNFLTGRHGDGSPFDGNGGILAHAFFPYDNSPGLSGDAHFDADEDWGSEMDLNTTADLYCVAVHEFGHSLGLMHSRWPISIMWPWMKGDCTLSKFDIAVIQKIYGPALEWKWKRPRPTAHPPQTTRPFIKPNWPTITTTITSTPSPSTASSSTTPIETATMSTSSAATILTTNNVKTTATATLQSTRENIATTITTAYRSPTSMTVTQTDRSSARSKIFPITTSFENLFQPSNTMTDFVLTQEEGFQTQETATPKSPPTTQNPQTSPSTIFYPNTLPSKNPLSTLNSLLFQTSSSSDNVPYKKKSSWVPLSDQNGFLPQNQPTDQNDLSDKSHSTSNGLLLKSSPSDPNTQSSLNVLPFINSLSTPNSLSSQSQTSHPNDLSSKPQNSDSNILASVSTLFTRNGLPSQNLPSQPSGLLFKSSLSDQKSSPLLNTLFITNTSPSNPHSLPSENLPSQPSGLLFKSSLSDQKSSPLLNTLFITNTSPSNPHSLPSENLPSQPSGLLFKSSLSDQKSSPLLNTLFITNTSPSNPHSLPSKNLPSQPSGLLFKSSLSDQKSSPLLNTLFITNTSPSNPHSLPSENLPSQPSGLLFKSSLSDQKSSPLLNTLFITNTSPSNPHSLPSENLPSQPSGLVFKSSLSDQKSSPLLNTLFITNTSPSNPHSLPSENLPSQPSGLLFKSSLSDQKSSPLLNTLFITNTSPSNPHSLPSENLPSQPSGLLFKSSLSDQKSSPLLNTLFITNTSPSNPHSLPSKNLPSQPSGLLFKSSLSDQKSSPLLNTLFITNTSPSNPHSLPSENLPSQPSGLLFKSSLSDQKSSPLLNTLFITNTSPSNPHSLTSENLPSQPSGLLFKSSQSDQKSSPLLNTLFITNTSPSNPHSLPSENLPSQPSGLLFKSSLSDQKSSPLLNTLFITNTSPSNPHSLTSENLPSQPSGLLFKSSLSDQKSSPLLNTLFITNTSPSNPHSLPSENLPSQPSGLLFKSSLSDQKSSPLLNTLFITNTSPSNPHSLPSKNLPSQPSGLLFKSSLSDQKSSPLLNTLFITNTSPSNPHSLPSENLPSQPSGLLFKSSQSDQKSSPLLNTLFITNTSPSNPHSLPSENLPSQPSGLVFKSSLSDQKSSPLLNTLFITNTSPSNPHSLPSENLPSQPSGLLFKSSLSDQKSSPLLNTLFITNTSPSNPHSLPSENLPSQPSGLLFKSSLSDQKSSPLLNTLFITNTSPSNPHSLPSQNLPSQPSGLLFKSSLSDQKSSPLLNTLFITNTSPSNPHSLASANHFYTYQNHPKNPHYLNEIGKIHISIFSHLPKLPSSSLDQSLYLETSKEPLYLANSSLHDYQYQHIPDSAGENGLKRKISKPMSSEKPKLKHSDPFVVSTQQLIQAFTSITNQPKSSAANFRGTSQLLNIQHSSKIQDQHSADELVFGMHRFPEQNSSSLSTQLYKTATVSMTTKPVVSSNELKWMLTPTSHVTIDSEPTIPTNTSPMISVSSHLQHIIYNESGLQTDSYFDTAPFTKIVLFDKKANNPKGQERAFQIATEQQNGEVFKLKHKVSNTDRNGEKTIKNIKNKEELYEGLYQEKPASEQPYILKEWTNGNSNQKIIPILHRNSYDKLEPTTSKYSKIYRKLQPTQPLTLDKTKRISSDLRVPLISSEAVPGFGKALRQQNQEREVFLPYSLQESVVSTFLNGPTHPTRDVPFVHLNTLSSPTTLFAGGADARKNRPFQVVAGKKRVKMFKPRFRQKRSMQQFIQTLLYSTMHMIPPQGPPLRDTKLDPSTTPTLHQNIDVGMRTLSAPPTNRMLSRIVTSSFKAKPYLIPRAISHIFLNSQTSPTTQKWTGDTQRNLPQISNFQAQDSAKNYLRESLRILSPVQQTTPLLLTIQNPLGQQPISKDQGYNDRNSNLQASSLLPFRLKLPVSDQENVQTTSETIFYKPVTPHQHQQQHMLPLSTYAKKLKDNQGETGSSSRIHKRSLDESTPNVETTLSENWMSTYSLTLATFPSLVSQSTLYSHQVDILNIPLAEDNAIKSSSERNIHYSETDGITTMPTTDPRKFTVMQPWCSGSVQIDGATIDGNGTINIFNGSSVMRFPFCATGSRRKRRRAFIPISRIFPNGPNNVTAAASIILGKKKRWERTYLFQGHLVWRYRKCRRRYCLDRGYPTNISQEFNVSTPIEVRAAYVHIRRRTLFLFNGTSFYHTVRCLRWSRQSGCNSTETEMQPGLLSSLRGIDAMFTHQGSFYVVHGGSYFMTMLRSMRNNVLQHGSIAESWYGCPRKTP